MTEIDMNRIDVMSHEQAVSTNAVERYLLGELTDKERDAFEAHYFDCKTCFEQVQLGGEFLHHARQVLDAEPARDPQPERNWLAGILGDFRRPAMAFMTAMLLCAVGIGVYQSREIADLKAPRVEARYMLAGDARGGPVQVLKVARNAALSLRVEYLRKPEFVSYRAQVLSEQGRVKYSISVPTSQTDDSVTVSLPADALTPGVYKLVVLGVAADGTQTEAGHGNFELQFAN
jgi:hypothetical protein